MADGKAPKMSVLNPLPHHLEITVS